MLRSALRSAVKIAMLKMLVALKSLLLFIYLTVIDSMHYSVTKPDHKSTNAGISHLTVTPQRLL